MGKARNCPTHAVFQIVRIELGCYRSMMKKPASNWPVRHLTRVFGWRRLRVVVPVCFFVSLLFVFSWQLTYLMLIGRLLFFGLCGLLAFGLFEVWPKRLPNWIARWVLQVAAVAAIMPIAVWIGYSVTNMGLPEPWWRNQDRLIGFGTFVFLAMLLAPWIAVAALLKQIRNDAQQQAMAFDLERSEYEKQALNARLRVLQAQVEPHFLFNTLANVRELVTTGSTRAPQVLDSLIAYLRAAVPRINEPMATMAQELDLVRAYLEVMHMRMPDRLMFSVEAEEAVKTLICPPMTLLTLVENAMRHGIDPAEDGGRIDVRVTLEDGCCHVEVIDSGIGMGYVNAGSGMGLQSGLGFKLDAGRETGLGTGLTNLRERLQLQFGADVKLKLSPVTPHGTRAEIRFAAHAEQE